MRKLPPLTELRAFEAAARHLSFKLAAAELGVTPTAISHQIKLLEQHCGQLLFRRRPRPLALTRAGQQLYPVIHQGFTAFTEALSTLPPVTEAGRLRITATNAFSARWLLPRLPKWGADHPYLKLDIVGTDTVLDLNAGQADLAVRYARERPRGIPAIELVRDTFLVVASPTLVGAIDKPLHPTALVRFPLIEAGWPSSDRHAPTWQRWQEAAGARYKRVPELAALVGTVFQEELHAIEAAIAGQGIAICSDVLIAPELASGVLVPVSRVTLSGYGFYIVHRADHPQAASILAFATWARTVI